VSLVLRARAGCVLSIAILVACSGERAGRTRLSDGRYKLECRKPLGDCLVELTDVCREHGYDVVQGKEEKRRYGVDPVTTEVTTSEAIVRCRSANALLLGDKPSPLGSSSAPPVRTTAQSRCFPGSTQACLGPAACKGAQTCGAKGTAFGPCNCGTPTPSPEAPDASPASESGPPPTWAIPAADAGAP